MTVPCGCNHYCVTLGAANVGDCERYCTPLLELIQSGTINRKGLINLRYGIGKSTSTMHTAT